MKELILNLLIVSLFFQISSCENESAEDRFKKEWLVQIRTPAQDSIENVKSMLFSIKDSGLFRKGIDSLIMSHKDKAEWLFNIHHNSYYIAPFAYKFDNGLLKYLENVNSKSYPYWFRYNLKNNIPIYLLIREWDVEFSGGNRFENNNLSRKDVGQAYDMGSYEAQNGTTYSISFVYLDKKYDTTDYKFPNSGIHISTLFGILNIGCTGRMGSLRSDAFNYFTPDYQFGIKDFSRFDDKYMFQEQNNLLGFLFEKNNQFSTITELLQSSTFKFTLKKYKDSQSSDYKLTYLRSNK
ncbi:MAG: hypothetical protein HY252_14150 [Sphingobacteriales bacterium]|nr:hypothetical protein [Sphingobacteriales bacterium]